jgi:hypothetical protein
MRLLEESTVHLDGPSERSPFMPEERAGHEWLGDGSTVDRDKGTGCSLALLMQRTGNEFFAHPTFPSDEHRSGGIRDLTDQVNDLAERRTTAKEQCPRQEGWCQRHERSREARRTTHQRLL